MDQSIMTRNNVKITGNGTQPIIFAHGLGCDQHMWRFVAPAFEKDYRVVLFDYVGSGKSDLTKYTKDRYSDLDGYAQDLLDICEELELKDAVFVGHSVSAVIGVLASIRNTDYFNSLILIGPSPRYINDPPEYIGGFEQNDLENLLDLMEKNYTGWASYLAPLIMANPDRPDLAQELEESFCTTDPDIANQFAKATFFADNREDLVKVTVPTLILQCSEDIIAPLEVGAYVHQQIPKSSLRFMEATGHCPHMSHPEETIASIEDFLIKRKSLSMQEPEDNPIDSYLFTLSADRTILNANINLLHLLDYQLTGLRGCQFETILTQSSRIFCELHFFPHIKLNSKIENMHLSLRSANGVEIPILLNAINKQIDNKFIFDCRVIVL